MNNGYNGMIVQLISCVLMHFFQIMHGNSLSFNKLFDIPCNENRAKIDDLIAILGAINRAIYRDKIGQFDDFSRYFC
jgi:hypothetical protein